MTTRGIYNNNPGNIRRSSDDWLGLSKEQNDCAFFQFITAYFGLRCMAKILKKYWTKHNKKSVAEIISRWAPTTDKNPTEKYILYVCNYTHTKPFEHLDLSENTMHFERLMEAIIRFENNGQNPYSIYEINRAIEAAL